MDKLELILDGFGTGFELLGKLFDILVGLMSFIALLVLAPLWIPLLLLGLAVNKMKRRP